MKIDNLSRYKNDRFWIIGDFIPSLLKTKGFEVGIMHHKNGDRVKRHIHKVGTEYNIVLEGHVCINSEMNFYKDDIFIVEPGEAVEADFLESTRILVVKVPSIIGDKFEVENV